MRVEKDVSFKDVTTLKVGGRARKVVYLENEEELVHELTHEQGDFLIMGGGSNILPPENDYEGVVYIPIFKEITSKDCIKDVVVTVDAGANWDAVVEETVHNNWWGLENLSAIPGTVGGAVFQNIGAYGAALSQTVQSVRAFDTKTKEIQTFTAKECDFKYRTSLFKKEVGRYVIVSTTLVLSKTPQPNLEYRDLQNHFKGNATPTLQEIRNAVIAIRKEKFPDLSEYGTAGSFFLNPVVSEEQAQEFQKKYPGIPVFQLPEGGVKIPLAWILDNVLNAKEMCVGGAFVWKEQALVIATKDGATASDVRTLQKKIQNAVYKKLHLHITPEVRIL